MSLSKISIIIVNYNGGDDTLECLRSLESANTDNHKIIVVDNASDDALFVLNKIHDNFPSVKILALPHNHGFAGGVNIGINYALENGAEYVILLNNDTVVAPDFIAQIVSAAESDKKIGIVGAKIYYFSEKNRIWFIGGEFSWTDGGRHIQDGAIDSQPNDTELKDAKYVTGCALLIKKQVIEKIGLLDEDFFMYYEDIDWSLSARKAGYRVVVAPAAHIWHKVSRSAVKMGASAIHYYHIRNALLLAKKHAPISIKALIYAWSIWHYLKQALKLVFRDSASKLIARAIILGISDFYHQRYGSYKR